MSQYQIPLGESGGRFRNLSLFEQGYIEAMFWTECNSDNEVLADCTFDDLSEEARDRIHADCTAFLDRVTNLFLDLERENTLDEVQAGHDFWLTRNRHGAGFWDRGLGDLGDKLTEIAHSFGEQDLYRGYDQKLYV